MTLTEIEARAVDAMRKADHFTASLFLGRGRYRIVLDLARGLHRGENGGPLLDPAAFTRRAIIYAIAPDGHAKLLTAALIAKLLSLKSKG